MYDYWKEVDETETLVVKEEVESTIKKIEAVQFACPRTMSTFMESKDEMMDEMKNLSESMKVEYTRVLMEGLHRKVEQHLGEFSDFACPLCGEQMLQVPIRLPMYAYQWTPTPDVIDMQCRLECPNDGFYYPEDK